MSTRTSQYGTFPNIPDGFPNPDEYETWSRDSILDCGDLAVQSYLNAVNEFFIKLNIVLASDHCKKCGFNNSTRVASPCNPICSIMQKKIVEVFKGENGHLYATCPQIKKPEDSERL